MSLVLGLKKYRERGMESKDVMGMRSEGLEMETMVSGCLRRDISLNEYK